MRLEHASAETSPSVDVKNLEFTLKAGCASRLLVRRRAGGRQKEPLNGDPHFENAAFKTTITASLN